MTDPPLRAPPPPAPAGIEWETLDPREELDYNAETGTYRASFEPDRATIGETIILVVAAVTRTDPLELPLLYPVIDSEMVERLVNSSVTGSPSGDLHISFTYVGCEVTVHSYGVIAVCPLEEGATD